MLLQRETGKTDIHNLSEIEISAMMELETYYRLRILMLCPCLLSSLYSFSSSLEYMAEQFKYYTGSIWGSTESLLLETDLPKIEEVVGHFSCCRNRVSNNFNGTWGEF